MPNTTGRLEGTFFLIYTCIAIAKTGRLTSRIYSFLNFNHLGRQKSVNPLAGRVGTFSYFKSRTGFMARDKQGIEGDRVRTGENYERTRENAAEFARAAKGGKQIRLALNTITKKMADGGLTNRLSRLLFQILKTDPVSARGMRLISLGDLSLLNDFQFNTRKELKTAFDPRFYTPEINRETGVASITVQPFTPMLDMSYHEAASHFRFVIAGIEVDFDNLVHNKFITSSDPLPIDMALTAPINLSAQLTADSPHPLILVFGIRFEDLVNGISYPLNDTEYNTLAVVAVSQETD